MAAPDTARYVSPWPKINAWDPEIRNAESQVYADTGVWVPENVVMDIAEIETGGDWPDPPNYAGYAGVMQVGPGSMGAYDMGRVVADKNYSMWAGVNELALRERDSGFLPWRNVAVGYFSGHYYPTGSADQYNTDYQYQAAFDRNINQLREAGDPGLPSLAQPLSSGSGGGGTVGMLGDWSARLGLFALGAALLAAGLWVLR